MPESDLNKLKKEYFQKNEFEKYNSCHSREDEEVLVDSTKGVFIATKDSKVTLVAWADPTLTKLRVDQFYSKCAKLQPTKKK